MLDFGCWILVVVGQNGRAARRFLLGGAPFRCEFSPFNDDFGGSVGSFCNFRNIGIGILPKTPGPNSGPARDLTQKWRLTIYSIVKEPDAASFSIPSYTGQSVLRVAPDLEMYGIR